MYKERMPKAMWRWRRAKNGSRRHVRYEDDDDETEFPDSATETEKTSEQSNSK